MEHVTVYREPGRYAGWPANYGMWAWGDEIVTCFTRGYPNPRGGFHTRDRSRPFATTQARSLDGGRTWGVEDFPGHAPGGRALSVDEHQEAHLQVAAVLDVDDGHNCRPGGVDFTHPDFALLCARSGLGAGARSWYYTSTDRCRTWNGPYRIPSFGLPGISARTDYLVSGPNEVTLLLTAAQQDGREGPVFCARTTDGGANFDFQSWVDPQPQGFAIMPASVRLDDRRIVTAVRRADGYGSARRNWIELYTSGDNGATWQLSTCPVSNTGHGGSPPTLTRLPDGRLILAYGYRNKPYGVRATTSIDDGLTWSPAITLRDDGGDHDLGYPRTVTRADDSLVTAYYFNDQPEGDRYIAATIWRP